MMMTNCYLKVNAALCTPYVHYGSFLEVDRTPATCTKAGTIYYECSECGASRTGTITAPGHSYGSAYSVVEPTCVYERFL